MSVTDILAHIREGDTEAVELFLEDMPDNALKICDSSGNTPLHVASMTNHHNILKMLLDSDADVMARNTCGKTAMDLAEEHQQAISLVILRDYATRREERTQRRPFSRRRDRFTFIFSVALLQVTQYCLIRTPLMLRYVYIALLPFFMVSRFLTYRPQKAVLFLLDFCYFVQVLMVVYLFFMPDSVALFRILFVFTNGPLLFAVIAWSNSLVFHSLDKLTSIFIHTFPVLTIFALRWYSPNTGEPAQPFMIAHAVQPVSTTFDPYNTRMTHHLAVMEEPNIREFFVNPLLVYLAWQVVYLFIIHVVLGYWVNKDHDIIISFRYLRKYVSPGNPLKRVMLAAPTRLQEVVYIILLLGLAICTFIPTWFMYRSWTFHATYCLTVWMMCVYNGANRYFKYLNPRRRRRAGGKEAKELGKGKKQ